MSGKYHYGLKIEIHQVCSLYINKNKEIICTRIVGYLQGQNDLHME